MKKILNIYTSTSLILRILIGMGIGLLLAFTVPQASKISMLGTLFVGALKAIAPLLVAVLVTGSLAQRSSKLDKRFGLVIFFYLLSTWLASFAAVIAGFLFPQKITFNDVAAETISAPQGLGEVIEGLLSNVISNPIAGVANGNYLSILFWSVVIGLALRKFASEQTQEFLKNISDAVTEVVRWVIETAPFGILGLVFSSVSENGLNIFKDYGRLLLLLVGTMLFVALVLNPLIVGVTLRRNPYPLVFRCIRESAFTAFFTRSSAANIPVNMELCRKLGLDKDMYSVSIPLGSTINMDGAAVTITIMSMAAVHTLGIPISFGSALFLSFLSALAAGGSSGVAGGSLLLIPMACSLFGVPDTVSMQVVAIGFIIGVVQDSMETAVNSSGDALFTAAAELAHRKKNGGSLPKFLGGDMDTEI
ncbi:MAG: serine/threonine transporter SstT [Oscillospiraceae bacterium]|nr:serine/threonine transporter SstT [Oscillospiraceae bacterium]